jgi:hypothetical protein
VVNFSKITHTGIPARLIQFGLKYSFSLLSGGGQNKSSRLFRQFNISDDRRVLTNDDGKLSERSEDGFIRPLQAA